MGFEDRHADLKRMDLSATYDYSTFRYVSIFEAGAKRVSDEDYEVVPDEYKSINPLKKGAYSLLWIIFTVITLILSFYCVKHHREHSEYFLPVCVALGCELCIQMILNSVAFRKPLEKNRTFTIECVVVKVISESKNSRLTLIVPEKQQFVEDIPFDNQFLKKIPTNVPVRLYFENEFTEMIKYCKIL